MPDRAIVSVAVPAPLPGYFDYALPPDMPAGEPAAGVRVRVPFGRKHLIGVVVGHKTSTDIPAAKLRAIAAVVDATPVVAAELLTVLRWAADYYCHPPGEVFAAALPRALRQGGPVLARVEAWELCGGGSDEEEQARWGPRQKSLLEKLVTAGGVLETVAFASLDWDWRRAMNSLVAKGRVRKRMLESAGSPAPAREIETGPELTGAQRSAVEAIAAAGEDFHCTLLYGVTGSGKTEVYFRLIERVLAAGRQALVLVPEIGLTPQLVARFERRFNAPLAVLHSGLSAGRRMAAWRAARAGRAPIVIGTRSAVFAALARPGLIVVDEEHDGSFKQQDGFRYHARDLAVMRSREAGIPIVLGSATPALETLHNAAAGRYRLHELPARPGAAKPPKLRVIDLRMSVSVQGLSGDLLTAVRKHLAHGGQVLLFLNRRGYAPAWFCKACGWTATCRRCDARLTLHLGDGRLHCHHCGVEQPPPPTCPDCEQEPGPVGQGTQRIEEVLARHFADVPLVRIDRDSTRRRGTLEHKLATVNSGAPCILVGTQMLTKGHHFPEVSLVGIVNADQGLFGTDFRSNERLAQVIVQVAGRAGRAERPGEVLIQTAYPEHPLLQCLVESGYRSFADEALDERRRSSWPPYSRLALLRARAPAEDTPLAFLREARQLATRLNATGVHLLGPATAPMAKRAGSFRAQLLLQARTRTALHALLRPWLKRLADLPMARRVHWSIDVDPQDLF